MVVVNNSAVTFLAETVVANPTVLVFVPFTLVLGIPVIALVTMTIIFKAGVANYITVMHFSKLFIEVFTAVVATIRISVYASITPRFGSVVTGVSDMHFVSIASPFGLAAVVAYYKAFAEALLAIPIIVCTELGDVTGDDVTATSTNDNLAVFNCVLNFIVGYKAIAGNISRLLAFNFIARIYTFY